MSAKTRAVLLCVDVGLGVAVTVYMVGMLWFGPVAGGEVRGEGLWTLSLIAVGTCGLLVLGGACFLLRRQLRWCWPAVPNGFLLLVGAALILRMMADLADGVRHYVWMLHPDGAWHTERLFGVVCTITAAKILYGVDLLQSFSRRRSPGKGRGAERT